MLVFTFLVDRWRSVFGCCLWKTERTRVQFWKLQCLTKAVNVIECEDILKCLKLVLNDVAYFICQYTASLGFWLLSDSENLIKKEKCECEFI